MYGNILTSKLFFVILETVKETPFMPIEPFSITYFLNDFDKKKDTIHQLDQQPSLMLVCLMILMLKLIP